jgi:hypothetical protein
VSLRDTFARLTTKPGYKIPFTVSAMFDKPGCARAVVAQSAD